MADEIGADATKGVDLPRLLGAVAVCQLAGLLGFASSAKSLVAWYPTLRKPSFTPPGAVFGPVWTVLYLLMGVSLYLVSRRGRADGAVRRAEAIFAVQLLLNAAWTPLFFGRRSPLLGLLDILPMWAAVMATMRAFYRISKPAALLLVPYLLWVSYAVVLNLSIWRLNR